MILSLLYNFIEGNFFFFFFFVYAFHFYSGRQSGQFFLDPVYVSLPRISLKYKPKVRASI